MKSTFFGLALVALTSFCGAATIVFESDDNNGFSRFDGTDLPVGNLVRVGFFDISDSQVIANKNDIAYLSAHFFEFGAGHVGDQYGIAGHLAATLNRDTTGGSIYDNEQIYIWAFAVGNPNAADDFAAVVAKGIAEHGIFYADMSLVPTWRIKPQSEIPNTTTIDLSDLTGAADNAGLTAAGKVLVGQFPLGTSDATGAPNFGLEIVPEPSAATAVIASVGLLALRRRRRA